MRFDQTWQGRNCSEAEGAFFPVSVPGNIQYDFGVARGFTDVQFADGYKQYIPYEDDAWEYSTHLRYSKREGERVYFVSKGIDYRYDILLNGEKLYSYEGMFRKAEVDLTDHLKGEDDLLTVYIYPHPKRKTARPGTRDEADESCKPPVSYGWDWNPRLVISGLWDEAYIETRDAYYIGNAEVLTDLSEDLSVGTVRVSYDCEKACTVTVSDADGNIVYSGTDAEFTVQTPELWWCNGQGTPYLYTWKIENEREQRVGHIGFRRLRLVRNTGAVDPPRFPKSRYATPTTIELNGRRILAKGSNWVNPDIFWGQTDEARYDSLLTLARDAHMNILRMWGGSSVCKQSFYDLCDRYGIMVWQEFMLACNNYPDTEHYLSVLESEARAIICSLRSHPSLALWCGGNELFNGWSGMTDQSHPLRLLNSLCYELDRKRPFFPTSPLIGMAHGGYQFYSHSLGLEVFEEFQKSHDVAYTEFGVPSIASVETLKKIIPEDELFPIKPTAAWIAHHGFNAWGLASWTCLDTLERYFGESTSLEETVERSNWLQCVGYQGAFEEMRRQWPHCGMMLNWCFDEPWMTAANNSLIEFPSKPKPAYEYVKSALRPKLFSARVAKFAWVMGSTFEAEIWLLNDTPEAISGEVHISLQIGNESIDLLDWKAEADANSSKQGPTVRCVLPKVEGVDRITLKLDSADGMSSSYCLQLRAKKLKDTRAMNM
ncbi:MAG: hypothetical protein E7666_06940 [Ruminococcaceae bacterium]|nr:hypothetical protein [Oscillospiraceae bacterium]